MSDLRTVELPWPGTNLSPNARVHWQDKRKTAKAYRETAYWLAFNADLKPPHRDEGFILKLTFHPPLPKRKRDLDNMLASFKPGLDGIADAMQVNDERFGLWISRAEAMGAGKVIVEVMP